MARQGINTGTSPNSGTGDTLLDGGVKINENFIEVYNLCGDGTNLAPGIVTSIQAGNGISIDQSTNEVTITASVASTSNVRSETLFVSGISTLGNSNGIGTVTVGVGQTALLVDGEARIIGILTVGRDSITFDGEQNEIRVGGGVTITSSGQAEYTGVVTATSFVGDGSQLTGITAAGEGVRVQDSGSAVGTAGTINFGNNLSVSALSAGIVTVTASGGGSGITTDNIITGTAATFTGGISVTGAAVSITSDGIDVTGVVTATSFDGTLNVSNLTGSYQANGADAVPLADQSGNAQRAIVMGGTTPVADGVNAALNGNNDFTFNPSTAHLRVGAGFSVFGSTGVVTATSYHGDGSQLTGIVASGSGVQVQDSGSVIGAAGTINFAANLSVTPVSLGIVTVTGSAGGASTENVLTDTLQVLGVTTATNQIEVRSSDSTPGRVDYFCEVSNAHFTRLQAAPHAEYSGNPTVVLPTVGGDMLVGDTSSAITQSVNTTGIITAASFSGNLTGVSTGSDAVETSIEFSSSSPHFVAFMQSAQFQDLHRHPLLQFIPSTNTLSVGNLTASTSATLGGICTVNSNGVDVTGVVTATSFEGDGSNLTGISAGFTTSRYTASATSSSLGIGVTTNLDVAGSNSYALLKVGISSAAWVRLYTDDVSRTNDATRAFDQDPAPGSGVIAEVRTTVAGVSTFRMSPGVIGYNDAVSIGNTIFTAVVNNESSTTNLQVDLTLINLEAGS